jgi:hypothetical protein
MGRRPGSVHLVVSIQLCGVMLFPDDQTMRSQWLAVLPVDAYRHRLEPAIERTFPPTPMAVLELISDAPSAAELARRAAERAWEGRVAAEILLSVLSLSEAAPNMLLSEKLSVSRGPI